MDQAQLLSLIGSLYDKLVADVAARVQSQMDLGPVTDIINEAIDLRIKAVLDDKLDEAFAAHCEEYDHDSYDTAVNKLDDIPEDFSEAVKEAVQELNFDIRVKVS